MAAVFNRSRFEFGLPKEELWGRGKSPRKMTDARRERRRLRRKAKSLHMPLKAFLKEPQS